MGPLDPNVIKRYHSFSRLSPYPLFLFLPHILSFVLTPFVPLSLSLSLAQQRSRYTYLLYILRKLYIYITVYPNVCSLMERVFRICYLPWVYLHSGRFANMVMVMVMVLTPLVGGPHHHGTCQGHSRTGCHVSSTRDRRCHLAALARPRNFFTVATHLLSHEACLWRSSEDVFDDHDCAKEKG